jgi:SAM-dependent methyltransferase
MSMRILNHQLFADLEAKKPLRLNLGCGQRPRPGFYGVDHLDLPGVDIVADLNRPFTQLPDDSVSEIYTRHTLEHVPQLLPLMAELHRITRADGRIEIIVPHFSNPFGYSDPTHVRFFGLYSFFYFADEVDQPSRKVPAFYVPQRFIVESISVSLVKGGLLKRFVTPLVKRLVNRGISLLDWYERSLCRSFPAESMHYVLKPKKVPAGMLKVAA